MVPEILASIGHLAVRNGAEGNISALPSTFTIDFVISASNWPDAETGNFQLRHKSPWIQTVGSNPMLLYEPLLSSRDNPLSLVEEAFEEYRRIPDEYVKMGSERFMEKYC